MGSRWNWVPALGAEKPEWRGTGPRNTFDDILSRLDTIHQRDGLTERGADGHTPGDSKDRAYA